MSSCATACVGGADNELVCQLLQDAIFDDVSLSPGSRSLLLNYSKTFNILIIGIELKDVDGGNLTVVSYL